MSPVDVPSATGQRQNGPSGGTCPIWPSVTRRTAIHRLQLLPLCRIGRRNRSRGKFVQFHWQRVFGHRRNRVQGRWFQVRSYLVLVDVIQIGIVHLVTSAGAVSGHVLTSGSAATSHVLVTSGRSVHARRSRLHRPVRQIQRSRPADLHPESTIQRRNLRRYRRNVRITSSQVVIARIEDVPIFLILQVFLYEDQIAVQSVHVTSLIGVL